jgi:hypothetical protein
MNTLRFALLGLGLGGAYALLTLGVVAYTEVAECGPLQRRSRARQARAGAKRLQ